MDDAEALRILSGALLCPTRRRWSVIGRPCRRSRVRVLPSGYRSVCERWGPVQIDGTLNAEAPADDPRAGLVGFAGSHNDTHRDLREDKGDGPGLARARRAAALGYCEDGTSVLWQTAGEPDAWTVVLRRDDEDADDRAEISATGSRTLELLADWVARAARRAPLEATCIGADRTAWMGRGDIALDAFLGDLAKRHARLHRAIIGTRVRHSHEQLVVPWRSTRQAALRPDHRSRLPLCRARATTAGKAVAHRPAEA